MHLTKYECNSVANHMLLNLSFLAPVGFALMCAPGSLYPTKVISTTPKCTIFCLSSLQPIAEAHPLMDLPVDALLGIFLVEPLDLSLVSVVRTVCKRWNEASAAAINVLVRRMDTIDSPQTNQTVSEWHTTALENLKPLFFLDDVFQASSIQLKNGVLNKQTIPRLEGARAAIQKAVEAAQSFLQSHQLQHRFTKSELNFTPDRLDFADATTRMKNPEMLSLAKRIWFSANRKFSFGVIAEETDGKTIAYHHMVHFIAWNPNNKVTIEFAISYQDGSSKLGGAARRVRVDVLFMGHKNWDNLMELTPPKPGTLEDEINQPDDTAFNTLSGIDHTDGAKPVWQSSFLFEVNRCLGTESATIEDWDAFLACCIVKPAPAEPTLDEFRNESQENYYSCMQKLISNRQEGWTGVLRSLLYYGNCLLQRIDLGLQVSKWLLGSPHAPETQAPPTFAGINGSERATEIALFVNSLLVLGAHDTDIDCAKPYTEYIKYGIRRLRTVYICGNNFFEVCNIKLSLAPFDDSNEFVYEVASMEFSADNFEVYTDTEPPLLCFHPRSMVSVGYGTMTTIDLHTIILMLLGLWQYATDIKNDNITLGKLYEDAKRDAFARHKQTVEKGAGSNKSLAHFAM